MSYGIKYTCSYKRLSNATTNIQILKRGYSGPVTDLVGDDTPLTIEFGGNINNIYEPTQGSGATIRVIADPLSLEELFTDDPQEFIVKVLNGTTLIWQGFVSTNIYSEDYSVKAPLTTAIEIQCNDGMQLLDEIPYTYLSGALYTGFTSIAGILNTVLSKLDISFPTMITATSLMVTTGYTNLFIGLTVNNENYYNEKGVPMSCREVLNTIFQALGLVMSFKADKIYVFDPIALLTPTIAKSYTMYSGYSFTETGTTLGGYKLIGSDLPWYETGQVLDIVQPFNQIEVKYDPQTITELSQSFDEATSQPEDRYINWILGDRLDYQYCLNVPTTKEKYPNTFGGWSSSNPGVNGINGIAQIISGDTGLQQHTMTGTSEFYIEQYSLPVTQQPWIQGGAYINNGDYYEYEFPLSNVKEDENVNLELSFDIYVNTKNQRNITGSATEAGHEIAGAYLHGMELILGNHYYYSQGEYWSPVKSNVDIIARQNDADITTQVGTTYRRERLGTILFFPIYYKKKIKYYYQQDASRINDTWTTITTTFKLTNKDSLNFTNQLVSGSLKLRLYKNANAQLFSSTAEVPYSYAKDILIRNPQIRFLNKKYTQISNAGTSVLATISNSTYIKKSPLGITLKNGVGKYGVSKGAFSSQTTSPVSGQNILGLYRSGSTVCQDTINLVAQTLLSQYKTSRKQLNVNLDVKTDLLDNRFKIINDTYLPGINFYVVSGKYNDRNENLSAVLIEIGTSLEQLPQPTPAPTYVIPTTTPTPTTTPPPGEIWLGFHSSGYVNIEDLEGNTVDITITGYTSASQSWINCNYPPEGQSSIDYTIGLNSINSSATESSATESNKDPVTINTFSQTFTNVTSGTTESISTYVSADYTYCGDAWGSIYMEITDVTKTAGPGTISINPSAYQFNIP